MRESILIIIKLSIFAFDTCITIKHIENAAKRRSTTMLGPNKELVSSAMRRRNTVPIIHTRGTHYEIGFNIGRTFAAMIREHVELYWPLHKSYLPLYETQEGKKVYEETLACIEHQYPHYVREIRGTADGSGVAFHKLLLMHLDEILPNVAANGTQGNPEDVGCSDVICNQPGQEILGHNEDALTETMNHWYLIDAHVVEPGLPEEKFCSLSYAGFLPGYTMGYNHHGLVYSVNTLVATTLRSGKTGRYFLTRALLGAKNYVEAEKILHNGGHGAAEGFSVTMTFQQEGDRMFHNVEIGPVKEDENCSQLSVLTTSPGEYFYHCNMYLRLPISESPATTKNSTRRGQAISKHPPPKSVRDVINILSDQTDDEFPVYRETEISAKTICTGIFDLVKKTWSIYTDKPNCTEPVVVLPLQFKS